MSLFTQQVLLPVCSHFHADKSPSTELAIESSVGVCELELELEEIKSSGLVVAAAV